MFPLWRGKCQILKRAKIIRTSIFLFMVLCTYLCLIVRVEDDWSEELPFMKTQKDARVKKIVFWTSRWGDKKWGTLPGEKRSLLHCGADVTCQLYFAKRHPLLYDALVFHGRDSQRPPSERSSHQAYIMFLEESPMYRRQGLRGDLFIPGANFYNWTMTYSRTSDFKAPYFNIRQHSRTLGKDSSGYHGNQSVINKSGSHTIHGTHRGQDSFYNLLGLEATMHHLRHAGEAFTVWVAGHCYTNSRRELYVDALQQHLAVDIYGKCGKNCKVFEKRSGLRCHEFLVRTGQYKFYLSFENSACRDYITEKVLDPLNLGLVPIVYGGLSTEDYMAMLPPGSFIDVRNFTSPKHLAEYLLYLDNNDEAYLAYHAWREEWEIGGVGNVWCDVCHALHNVGNVPPRNVDWGKFWNPATECDSHLLEKVLGKNGQDLSPGMLYNLRRYIDPFVP